MEEAHMKIRPLQPGDYEKAKYLLEQIQITHSQNRPDIFRGPDMLMPEFIFLSAQDAPEKLSAVAEKEDGTLAGICLVSAHENLPDNFVMVPRKFAMVDTMCVSPDCRRQGIAEQLLTYVKERAAELDFDSVELKVAAFNGPAQSLYAKLGFTPQSHQLEWKIKK